MTGRRFIKAFGPGILFASAAIGTSHLILSTQAGAHYGLIMGWVILVALVVKYPFFEFGPRYAAATGQSLLTAYLAQGRWALWLYMTIIFCSMFTVVGAVGAAAAGLLANFLGIQGISSTVMASGLLILTLGILLVGRFKFLDQSLKLITSALFIGVLICFAAVIIKGPATLSENFIPDSAFDKSGLVLIIGLLGWMPVGLEASTFSSIWTVKKIEATDYHPTLRESLFDFNLGYGLTAVLAFFFLVIGAYSVYGTGAKLEGSPVVFTNNLVQIFTDNIGQWSFSFVAIAAFGAIYGTLLTAWDAFARSFVECTNVLKAKKEVSFPAERREKFYALWMMVIGVGAIIVISLFGHSLILLLKIATVVSFMTAPAIAILNYRAVMGLELIAFRPPGWMRVVALVGLVFMISFAIFYIYSMMI